jgi:hypothetical protein
VRDHGATAFVRAHPARGCTGTLTLLDIGRYPVADWDGRAFRL